MTTLRTAAQQALDALKMMRDQYEEYACPACDHADAAIYALKEALVEDAMQKFTDVNQELEAALAEPDWQDLYLKEKKRADMWRDKYESVAGAEQRIHPLAEPVQEPFCYVYEYDSPYGLHREFYPREYNGMKPSRTVPLYAAPPQRKPLTREEAIELWADKSDGPSNSEIVLYCRAIERAHGIGGDE